MMKNYTVEDALDLFYKIASSMILMWISCGVISGVTHQYGILAGIITGIAEVFIIVLMGFILCYLDDE